MTKTYKTTEGSITLMGAKPRIIFQVGFVTPAEYKRAVRDFKTIKS